MTAVVGAQLKYAVNERPCCCLRKFLKSPAQAGFFMFVAATFASRQASTVRLAGNYLLH